MSFYSGSLGKPSVAVTGSGPRETLQRRLREAGLETERFVDLTDGTKASYRDHTDPHFQYELTTSTATTESWRATDSLSST